MPRTFSLEEAKDTLALILPWVTEIMAIRSAILKRQPEVWPVVEKAAGNGGSLAASQMAEDFDRLDDLVRRIQQTGVLLKDINQGLLDFPHQRDGRVVYLCWRYGEADILYWHDVDAGFAGRQPL